MARLLPSPSLDAWHSSLGGRVHLSPCVSLHLPPVVSPPGCLARLSGWTRSFVSLSSLVSLCLPSFVSRCLPAWMIQSGWTGSFVSLCHLSPVVFQPGCLARLSGWTGSFVSLCLPSFVSQPGCLARLGFICLPVSPFICLPLSPSLDAWRGSLGGRVHLSTFVSQDVWHPFVSLHLSPVVSQPGCLALFFWWTDSLFSLCLPSFGSCCLPAWMSVTALQADGFTCLPSFVSHLCGWTDSFVCLCLPLFVSRCLPAWMPGTALWVDGFMCLPLSPSLDVWHSRSAVSFTSRGSVLLAGSGLPSALALASVIPCLVDVGDRVLLCLPFVWTSWARGGSSSLSIVGYTLSVRSVPRYQLRSRADESGALRCTASATRRLC